MKIIIDDKIPYIKGVFEPFAEVIYLPGSATTPAIVRDADALITRTRTVCNEELLKDSKVKFIATATIGYDHIDTEYCEQAGIAWTNAPGCNAGSVEQYIVSAWMALADLRNLQLNKLTIGVVGVGHVGKMVAYMAEVLGMRVLLNDPPRAVIEGDVGFVDLKEIMQKADIISLHVPLNMIGEHATYHMVDKHFFQNLSKKVVLINACRGEVVNTQAVIHAIQQGLISDYIADCWEHEPDIDRKLLELTTFATPHIAGYSKDGKAMGTQMSVRAVSRFFGLGIDDWSPAMIEEPSEKLIVIDAEGMTDQAVIAQAVLHTYDIWKDDQLLRSSPADFEQLRGNYAVRREFAAYEVRLQNSNSVVEEKLRMMGFNIVEMHDHASLPQTKNNNNI